MKGTLTLLAKPCFKHSVPVLISPFVGKKSRAICIDRSLAQNQDSLVTFIRNKQPSVVIAGAEPFPDEALRVLSTYGGCVVRRGSGLANFNLELAKQLGVNIVNTPGINAPSVAAFISEFFGEIGSSHKVSVVGCGDIGSYLLHSFSGSKALLCGYSRRLSDLSMMTAQKKLLGLSDNVQCPSSMDETFLGATHLAVTLPLSKSTHHSLDVEHFTKLDPTARIVVVSEPEVLTDAAIKYLYASSHSVVFDNNPKILNHVRQILGLSYSDVLREGFVLSSKAMVKCQKQMDVYALMKAAQWVVPVSQDSGNKFSVSVIGDGIGGRMIAKSLLDRGHRVKVFGKPGLATTWGADIRNFSITETSVYATPSRLGILSTGPKSSGWRGYADDSYDNEFMSGFNTLCRYGSHQRQLADYMGHLSRRSLRSWEEHFPRHLKLKMGQLDSGIVRLYPTLEAAKEGFSFQTRLDPSGFVRSLTTDDLHGAHPLISSLANRGFSNGVLVQGYSVQIFNIMNCLKQSIESRGGAFIPGEVDRVDWTSSVGRFWLNYGTCVESDKVVVSPGAYGESLLKGTPLEGKIQGVVGFFMEVKLSESDSKKLSSMHDYKEIKVHAPDPFGIMNFRYDSGRQILFASVGFGYVGEYSVDSSMHNLAELKSMCKNYAESLFPGSEVRRITEGVRPCTVDGLPYVTSMGPSSVFAGGTSAGGAVLAPEIGRLALDALEGEDSLDALILSFDRKTY